MESQTSPTNRGRLTAEGYECINEVTAEFRRLLKKASLESNKVVRRKEVLQATKELLSKNIANTFFEDNDEQSRAA